MRIERDLLDVAGVEIVGVVVPASQETGLHRGLLFRQPFFIFDFIFLLAGFGFRRVLVIFACLEVFEALVHCIIVACARGDVFPELPALCSPKYLVVREMPWEGIEHVTC